MGLYEQLQKDDELKPIIPFFPTKKYIINGSTTKIEYRRLTLDYFIQNLFLINGFKEHSAVLKFFKLNKLHHLNDKNRDTKALKPIKVMLLNKQTMKVPVKKTTEAFEVWKYISEHLKVNYVKDKRLFLLQGQQIIKVLGNQECVLKVLENYKGK